MRIRIIGVKDFADAIRKAIRALKTTFTGRTRKSAGVSNAGSGDMSDLLVVLATIVRDDLRRNFLSEGSYYGSPWPKLARRTIRERIKMGFGAGPILRRTGSFAGSFFDASNPDHEARIVNGKIIVSTSHRKKSMSGPMADLVDKGYTNASGAKVPARRVFHPNILSPQGHAKVTQAVNKKADQIVRIIGK